MSDFNSTWQVTFTTITQRENKNKREKPKNLHSKPQKNLTSELEVEEYNIGEKKS